MAKKKIPRAQKKRTFTPEEIQKLKGWYQIRLPVHSVASLLGMSEAYFYELLNHDNDLRQILDKARADGKDLVTKSLFFMATQERHVEEVTEEIYGTGDFNEKGEEIKKKRIKRVKKVIPPDVQAAKFWTQTQEGFKITEALELTGKDGAPIKTQEVEPTKDEILQELSEITEMLKERSKE